MRKTIHAELRELAQEILDGPKVLSAADLKDKGLPFSKQASMAKLFASEKANTACYDAQQMMGGAGYIKEYPLERFARDVRITSIYEGTSEIQKIVISRDLLR